MVVLRVERTVVKKGSRKVVDWAWKLVVKMDVG